MIRVNVKIEGEVKIHNEDKKQIIRIKKSKIKDLVEKISFESKEAQRDIEKFMMFLPLMNTLGIGSKKDKSIKIYIDPLRFGSKRPEYEIVENYLLYKTLERIAR